jgi:microsomal prostaglandin-E synthase 2
MTSAAKLSVMTGTVAASYYLSKSFTTSALCEAPVDNVESPMLYQYQICPFCHRVKAYLDYLKLDYSTVEVNPLTKSELKFSKDYKKVPIAVIDGNVLNDSGAIIQYITDHFGKQAMPAAFFVDSERWLEWSEKKLAVMLYPNITRSFDESWECFGYANNVTEWSSLQQTLVRVSGPAAMFLANGKIKKKYNIVDERKELKEVLSEWSEALGDKKFVHGNDVSMSDLMVFGTLRAIRDFQTFREIMIDFPTLKIWFDNVDALTTSRS